MQFASSQEISLPTGCLKSLKSVRGLTLLTLRAATTICGARSGRALTAAPTYAHTSRAFDRTKSELSARRNWSGVPSLRCWRLPPEQHASSQRCRLLRPAIDADFGLFPRLTARSASAESL